MRSPGFKVPFDQPERVITPGLEAAMLHRVAGLPSLASARMSTLTCGLTQLNCFTTPVIVTSFEVSYMAPEWWAWAPVASRPAAASPRAAVL
jgi:hypothetical protein